MIRVENNLNFLEIESKTVYLTITPTKRVVQKTFLNKESEEIVVGIVVGTECKIFGNGNLIFNFYPYHKYYKIEIIGEINFIIPEYLSYNVSANIMCNGELFILKNQRIMKASEWEIADIIE